MSEEEGMRYCNKCGQQFYWPQAICAYDVCDNCFIPHMSEEWYQTSTREMTSKETPVAERNLAVILDLIQGHESKIKRIYVQGMGWVDIEK